MPHFSIQRWGTERISTSDSSIQKEGGGWLEAEWEIHKVNSNSEIQGPDTGNYPYLGGSRDSMS